ncbi:MAG: endolytic transglycosylase MltG [Candidatus Kapabacteria bacterium]|nr:endolytic transglycosylase MltG [Candidatus Kapabacteria bacterium]
MSRVRRVVLIVACVCVLVLVSITYSLLQLLQPVELSQPIELYISHRTSVSAVLTQLEHHSVIRSPILARIAVRIIALQKGTMQRGTIRIEPGTSELAVLMNLFAKRNLQTVTVTFQEGITLRRYADIAAEKIGCDKAEFLRIAYSDSLRTARGITSATIEGYFMPNTYEFYRNTPAHEIIAKLLDEQDAFWHEVASTATTTLNRHQTLTLASIVEAETPVDDEKPRVSGVYWNRLKSGMKLEADPTVQYIYDIMYPHRSSRRLRFADLAIEHPYNTYKYSGLPPAPINSPGRAAIRAALAPEAHNFYYFVAKLDGTHTHTFSRTSSEHERAVAIFRARRKAQKIDI